MPRAVLFDLDDTLLGNSMDKFLPAYFSALSRCVGDLVPPKRLIRELMRASEAMNANDDEALTNEEVFASVFYAALEPSRPTLERVFDEFYADEFSELRALTRRRPEARKLVEWATDQDLQVAVATNPMFPRVAVEQRLAWAGVPVDEFDYALVTTYENMHATKAHVSYYEDILERLGRRPEECLLVGDSWQMDILPAASIGIKVYWITEADRPPGLGVSLAGRGTLPQLWETVQDRGFPA